MRAIKFRARRIDTGQWVYGDYFKTPLTDENSGTTPEKGWYFLTGETRHCIGSNGVAFVVDEQTCGQWTGMQDRNGVSIYEGDIVFTDNEQEGEYPVEEQYYGVVTYAADKGYFFIRQPKRPYHPLLSNTTIVSTQVVGNIHANPELLKEH